MDVVTVLTLTPASQGQGYQPLEPLALNFNFQVAGGPGGRSTGASGSCLLSARPRQGSDPVLVLLSIPQSRYPGGQANSILPVTPH